MGLEQFAQLHALSKHILENLPDKKFDLVFYALHQTLVGSIAGESFVLKANSGGGRGRTSGKAEKTLASFSSTTRMNVAQRGGILPPGLWKIDVSSKYTGKKGKPVAPLIPIGDQRVEYASSNYDVAPFLIHGPGPLGSDGCLVIEKVERKRLLAAVDKAGGAVLLVSNALDGADPLSKGLARMSMA